MFPFDVLYTLFDALTDPIQRPLLLRALGSIWLGWALYGLTFTGVGLWVRRIFGAAPATAFDLLTAFWVGWAAYVGILQLWHFAAPIAPLIGWLLFALGMTGIVFHARTLWPILRAATSRYPLVWGLFALAAVLFGNSAMGAPSIADFALYHQQVILWNLESPIVAGLGNLHGRFAFNNSSFLYAALVDVWPLTGVGNHIAASLHIMALLALGLWGLARVIQRELLPETLFAALILPIVAWAATQNEYLRTPDSDLIPIVLAPVMGVMLLRLLGKRAPHPQAETLLMVALACGGVVSKLSFAAYGGLAILLALWASRGLTRWRWAVGVAFGGVIIGAWLVRGVILSGYPLYPSTLIAFPVDWRVACEAANAEAAWVYSWARNPGQPYQDVLGNWRWFPAWVTRVLRRDFEVFTPLLLAGLALALGIFWRRGMINGAAHRPPPTNAVILYLIAPIGALIFWFVTAPDVRFAGSLFWMLANGLLALVLTDVACTSPQAVRAGVIVLALVLTYDRRIEFDAYPPAPETGFYSAPMPELEARTTNSGLTVYIPTDNQSCYRAELPCTPHYDENLSLRVTGELSGGFRVENTPLECR
ncbi:MAG: LIC_10190 family membrane protein [Phototrophicaceae bacterium]|jgi:hypothetical protein